MTIEDQTTSDKDMSPFYKALIENSRDIIMLLDARGVLQFVSPSITTIFGYEAAELVGTSVFERVHPEDVDRSQQILRQILGDKEVPPFIVRYRHQDLSWRFVEVIAHYLGRETSDVMLTSRDVTEYEEDTQARRLVDASFEAAFNASSAINSISVVETGELLTVNDGWLNALGWTREEAIGKTALDLNIWGGAENRKRALAELERNAGLRGYRVELTTKAGETCVVRLDATYLYLPVGTRLYFSALDITEQEKTEEKLRQSQRLDALGHLTGGIAHDFNNLLSVIMGHAELAKDDPKVSGQLEVSLDAIFRASVTAADLIQQLLSFSKKQQLSPAQIPLYEHIEAMRPLLQTTTEKNIELNIINEGSDWLCSIDPLQLDNAILNMTINARDAMPVGGVLTMIVDEMVVSKTNSSLYDVTEGDYVRLRIQDTGSGMSELSVKHAFDPFYTTKQDLGGSGLGLSMVFGFISQSGGSVYFEPQKVGTCVSILLPRAFESKVLSRIADEADTHDDYSKSALVVEDNADVRDLVVRILESMGFEVTQAETSAEAQALEKASFDLLVCDLMLPGTRKGAEIAARFQESQPNLSVLFMSGYQEGILTAEDLQAPNVTFIQKPFRQSDFAAEISSLLERAK